MSLPCHCHCPVRGRVCSLVVGVEAPNPFLSRVSELQYEIGRIGVYPLGKEPLGIPLPEMFPSECVLLCHLFICCAGSQSPWECQHSALVSLRCCFHKATSTDPLKSGFRTTAVAHLDPLWKLWRQPRPWPSPHVHATAKPTAAKARLSQQQKQPLSVWMSHTC